MSKRRSILEAIKAKLETQGLPVFYWQDLDFEYGADAIAFRDLEQGYTPKNQSYEQSLEIEIRAIQFTSSPLIDSCGLLETLVNLVREETWGGYVIKTILQRDEKSVETKGKLAVRVSLFFCVIYRQDFE